MSRQTWLVNVFTGVVAVCRLLLAMTEVPPLCVCVLGWGGRGGGEETFCVCMSLPLSLSFSLTLSLLNVRHLRLLQYLNPKP
jgi:hypothetical protein